MKKNIFLSTLILFFSIFSYAMEDNFSDSSEEYFDPNGTEELVEELPTQPVIVKFSPAIDHVKNLRKYINSVNERLNAILAHEDQLNEESCEDLRQQCENAGREIATLRNFMMLKISRRINKGKKVVAFREIETLLDCVDRKLISVCDNFSKFLSDKNKFNSDSSDRLTSVKRELNIHSQYKSGITSIDRLVMLFGLIGNSPVAYEFYSNFPVWERITKLIRKNPEIAKVTLKNWNKNWHEGDSLFEKSRKRLHGQLDSIATELHYLYNEASDLHKELHRVDKEIDNLELQIFACLLAPSRGKEGELQQSRNKKNELGNELKSTYDLSFNPACILSRQSDEANNFISGIKGALELFLYHNCVDDLKGRLICNSRKRQPIIADLAKRLQTGQINSSLATISNLIHKGFVKGHSVSHSIQRVPAAIQGVGESVEDVSHGISKWLGGKLVKVGDAFSRGLKWIVNSPQFDDESNENEEEHHNGLIQKAFKLEQAGKKIKSTADTLSTEFKGVEQQIIEHKNNLLQVDAFTRMLERYSSGSPRTHNIGNRNFRRVFDRFGDAWFDDHWNDSEDSQALVPCSQGSPVQFSDDSSSSDGVGSLVRHRRNMPQSS